MLELGKYHVLEVLRETSVGLFLGDKQGNDVLLPRKYVTPDMKVGDSITVFVYKDSEERSIATTLKPKIEINRFAFLPVSMTKNFGAFLFWGIENDLFVPLSEQPQRMKEGQSYLVYLYLDKKTNRLVASAKVNKFLSNETVTVKVGEEVALIIAEPTDLGFNVIINHRHRGLLYFNETFASLKPGDQRKGYVKKIRDDHNIDVQLDAIGYKKVASHSTVIINKLKKNKGFLPLTDSSSPEEIEATLEMSKKTFKKAIGLLYRQRMIGMESGGIRLQDEGD